MAIFEELFLASLIKKFADSTYSSLFRKVATLVRSKLRSTRFKENYEGENDLALYRHFLSELSRVAVGRVSELEQALRHLKESDSCSILVEGPSGFGKTTFFAQLRQRLEEDKIPNAWHMFSRNFYKDSSEDARRFDRNLAEQLAWHTGRNISQIKNYQNFVIDSLERTSFGLVLLIDALDETDGSFLLNRIPPQQSNAKLKLVVTSRTLGNDTKIEAAGLPRRRFSSIIRIPPLNETEIAELMKKMGLLTHEAKKIRDISEGDPFFVRFLVEDFGAGRIEDVYSRNPPSLNRYLEDQFDQLADSASDIQSKIITQIVLSPVPIPRSELIATISGLNNATFRKAFNPIARFFYETDSGYVVCHNRFREFFAEQLARPGIELT